MTYPKDLTGLRFGKWKVLGYTGDYKWKCQCDCGNIRDISRNNLVSGDSTSCGCDSNKDKLKDLAGQRFGKLTVIEYNKDEKKWLCQCDCGNTVYKRSWDLRNGKATTCGCIKGGGFKRQDLTGKKCGTLTPIRYIGNHQWECKCDCGNTTIKTQTQLKNPNVSCGCQLNQNKREDLTGQVFGELTVTKYLGYGKYLCTCSCSEHNTRIVDASTLKSGTTTACEKCTKIKLDKYYDNKRIDLTGKTFGDLTVIGYKQDIHKWVCKCSCGSIIDVYGQHLRVGDTRSCGCKFGLINSNYKSYLEIEVAEFIKSIYPGNIIENHRGILSNNKEIDIYLPEKKIGIEINGTYWHNIDNVEDEKYHQNKVIEAYKKGVRLIHIYEYEWRNNEELIKRFLKATICEDKKRVYARDTVVEELNNSEVKEFLNSNHLQGFVPASVNLALKDKENNLLGIMSFDRPRFNENFEYEILRLSFLSNTTVVGGTQKLFKHFIDKYKPHSIISYCNIDKFQGNTYEKLGFKAICITKPNYVWVNTKSGEILSRYQTQKAKLIESGLGSIEQTENEIMKNNGYYKIYNSGNIKFEWRQD